MGLSVLIKGGGDLGSGVAHSLCCVGMRVAISELAQPLVIRRPVSFASALYEGAIRVEGVTAVAVRDRGQVYAAWAAGQIPVMADPETSLLAVIQPQVLVDATLAKRPTGTRLDQAPLVIALGPGFVAGEHAHVVIETMRGHDLGRIITQGSAVPNTGVPGAIQGYTWERLLRAPCAGTFRQCAQIGDQVARGQAVAAVDGVPVQAEVAGVVRGLLWDGLPVSQGQKVGDIDPRGLRAYCFTISDKSRAIGRAALEAILVAQRAGELG